MVKMPDTEQTVGDGFTLFWSTYPRRTGKGAARLAWRTALTKASELTIMAALIEQKHAGMFGCDAKFIPHPRTWLCQERWSDDLPTARRPEFRNGALEALARQWEAGDGAPMLEGPAGD